jgi:ankyrin repeat protein
MILLQKQIIIVVITVNQSYHIIHYNYYILLVFSLRRGAGVNTQDQTGFTALHHASLNAYK